MYIGKNGKGELFLAENTKLWDSSGNKLRDPVGKENKGFDAQSYYDLLDLHVVPHIQRHYPSFVYQQDNASIHCSQNVIERQFESVSELLNHLGIEILDWPAICPDLNPVEHCWAMLNKLVRNRLKRMKVKPKNKKQYFRLIQKCFKKLDNQHVINTFESFRERCETVLRDEGNNYNRY